MLGLQNKFSRITENRPQQWIPFENLTGFTDKPNYLSVLREVLEIINTDSFEKEIICKNHKLNRCRLLATKIAKLRLEDIRKCNGDEGHNCK